MGAAPERPPLSDAERLLWLVRHLQPAAFARTFRRGLSNAELLGVVAALPAERLRALADRARPSSEANAWGWGAPDRRPDRPLATAIRTARQQARISQWQLARLVGVRQAAVSQWEGGRAEPSGLHMAALLRVLPSLADRLDAEATPAARGQPTGTRAS
jgi:DNA-binding XRE family transcriptional regulator